MDQFLLLLCAVPLRKVTLKKYSWSLSIQIKKKECVVRRGTEQRTDRSSEGRKEVTKLNEEVILGFAAIVKNE